MEGTVLTGCPDLILLPLPEAVTRLSRRVAPQVCAKLLHPHEKISDADLLAVAILQKLHKVPYFSRWWHFLKINHFPQCPSAPQFSREVEVQLFLRTGPALTGLDTIAADLPTYQALRRRKVIDPQTPLGALSIRRQGTEYLGADYEDEITLFMDFLVGQAATFPARPMEQDFPGHGVSLIVMPGDTHLELRLGKMPQQSVRLCTVSRHLFFGALFRAYGTMLEVLGGLGEDDLLAEAARWRQAPPDFVPRLTRLPRW